MFYYPPLKVMTDVPVGNHYGSFGVKRKYSYHCGVDLYCNKGDFVFAIESGIVTETNWFTGPKINLPWWNDTRCVCVESDTGVIVYGEMQEFCKIVVGTKVKRGESLGTVETVLKKDKGKPMTMLHVMLLTRGTKETDIPSWAHDTERPKGLLDPTLLLTQCRINYAFNAAFRPAIESLSNNYIA